METQKAGSAVAKSKTASKAKATAGDGPAPMVEKTEEEKAADEQQAKISADVESKREQQLADQLQNSPYTGTLPSVGRIVHFFPSVNDIQARDGDVEFVAAVVVKSWEHHRCDLRIFTATEEGGRWTLRKEIPHKSKAHPLIADGAYWEWPPRV